MSKGVGYLFGHYRPFPPEKVLLIQAASAICRDALSIFSMEMP